MHPQQPFFLYKAAKLTTHSDGRHKYRAKATKYLMPAINTMTLKNIQSYHHTYKPVRVC